VEIIYLGLKFNSKTFNQIKAGDILISPMFSINDVTHMHLCVAKKILGIEVFITWLTPEWNSTVWEYHYTIWEERKQPSC
jgi:hypothetical protein